MTLVMPEDAEVDRDNATYTAQIALMPPVKNLLSEDVKYEI